MENLVSSRGTSETQSVEVAIDISLYLPNYISSFILILKYKLLVETKAIPIFTRYLSLWRVKYSQLATQKSEFHQFLIIPIATPSILN